MANDVIASVLQIFCMGVDEAHEGVSFVETSIVGVGPTNSSTIVVSRNIVHVKIHTGTT